MFTGVPVVTQVANDLVRIAGVSLGSGATGTISLKQGAGEVKMPSGIIWGPYGGDEAGDGMVTLDESVEVSWTFNTDPGANSGQLYVNKANGGDPAQFLISIINGHESEGFEGTGELEIYLRFHN